MEIIFILACIPLYIMNSFCDKYISTLNCKITNIRYNLIKFAIGTVILLPFFLGDASKFQFGILLCGVLNGTILTISKVLMLYGYEQTSVAYMTLCHSSGLLLPCILGHFLWQEPLTPPALFGILLVILSILLLKDTGSKKQTSRIGILIGLIILMASGGVMVLQKVIGMQFQGMGAEAFNFYGFISATLILSCINCTEKRTIVNKKNILLCAAGSAISLCVISLVMTRMTSTIPSVIMFPLFNGLGVILVTLLSAKIFKEKLTAKSGLGVLLGLFGLFLTNL